MSNRFIALIAVASLAVVGCEADRSITTTPPETALVRFINATNGGIDVAISGLVSTANTNIASAASTQCLVVNAASPNLSFRNTGTPTDLAGFTASFAAGHEYWVIALAGATATQFVTIDQAYTPTAAATDVGLIGLNGNASTTTPGPYDLHVAVPGTALGTTTVKVPNLAFGTPSAFVNTTVPFNTNTPPAAQPLQLQFTGAGNTTVARNAGNVTYVPNTSNIAIIIQGTAAAPTTLRSITNAGC